jgi:hypothetical protein
MAFHTIHTAPGLSERDRTRAHRCGPWTVASRHTPAELLRRAGFDDVTVVDQTAEFRAVAAAWIGQWDEHRVELVALHGDDQFATRQRERRAELEAIDDGLLQRSLLLGCRQTR